MSKEQEICKTEDNCSSGTCAPVSPFSREGLYFIMFIILLFLVLFIVLYMNGYF